MLWRGGVKVGDQVVHALDDINLEIGQGEYLSVMGPSGSGKSTLLGLLAGAAMICFYHEGYKLLDVPKPELVLPVQIMGILVAIFGLGYLGSDSTDTSSRASVRGNSASLPHTGRRSRGEPEDSHTCA